MQSSVPTDTLYYLLLNGQQAGPFTIGQLRSMWQSGSVTAQTQYWFEGAAGWQALIKLRAILEPAPTPRAVIQKPPTPKQVLVFNADGVGRKLPETPLRILPAFLLCLFLGGLGAHRFYVGKVGSGIFFLTAFVLFLFGFPWLVVVSGIWILLDFFFIIGGAFTDGEGRSIDKWT